MNALMQRAEQKVAPKAPEQDAPQESGSFVRTDVTKLTPQELQDPVARIVAAGMKLLYAPEMQESVREAIALDMPTSDKLAMSTAALMQTLDQKAQGGLPAQALFPAGMELLGEAAELVQAAGQNVTQQDYNDALVQLSMLLAKKLGASDQEVMQMHEQMQNGQTPGEGMQAQAPEPDQMPPGADEVMA